MWLSAPSAPGKRAVAHPQPLFQVLRLLNVIWCLRPSPRLAPGSSGFPRLEELCLATTSYSFIDDGVLQRILWASTSLRVLDLRGCFRVTPKGIKQLPCPGGWPSTSCSLSPCSELNEKAWIARSLDQLPCQCLPDGARAGSWSALRAQQARLDGEPSP